MSLKKELRLILKQYKREEKRKQEELKQRSSEEWNLITNYLASCLKKSASLGYNSQAFEAQQFIKTSEEHVMCMNYRDFLRFCRENHLKAVFTDKERTKYTKPEFAEIVTILF